MSPPLSSFSGFHTCTPNTSSENEHISQSSQPCPKMENQCSNISSLNMLIPWLTHSGRVWGLQKRYALTESILFFVTMNYNLTSQLKVTLG
uniref:Uncharacterized protein n=1 Tax=viral metagenome TaxID=1070528 RepID=A0A6C0J0F9_9ZZZZ